MLFTRHFMRQIISFKFAEQNNGLLFVRKVGRTGMSRDPKLSQPLESAAASSKLPPRLLPFLHSFSLETASFTMLAASCSCTHRVGTSKPALSLKASQRPRTALRAAAQPVQASRNGNGGAPSHLSAGQDHMRAVKVRGEVQGVPETRNFDGAA